MSEALNKIVIIMTLNISSYDTSISSIKVHKRVKPCPDPSTYMSACSS